MTRWRDDALELGRLGQVEVVQMAPCAWRWYWHIPGGSVRGPYDLTTEARAKRSAEAWLRRALKQAGKRLGGSNA